MVSPSVTSDWMFMGVVKGVSSFLLLEIIRHVSLVEFNGREEREGQLVRRSCTHPIFTEGTSTMIIIKWLGVVVVYYSTRGKSFHYCRRRCPKPRLGGSLSLPSSLLLPRSPPIKEPAGPPPSSRNSKRRGCSSVEMSWGSALDTTPSRW